MGSREKINCKTWIYDKNAITVPMSYVFMPTLLKVNANIKNLTHIVLIQYLEKLKTSLHIKKMTPCYTPFLKVRHNLFYFEYNL